MHGGDRSWHCTAVVHPERNTALHIEKRGGDFVSLTQKLQLACRSGLTASVRDSFPKLVFYNSRAASDFDLFSLTQSISLQPSWHLVSWHIEHVSFLRERWYGTEFAISRQTHHILLRPMSGVTQQGISQGPFHRILVERSLNCLVLR